MQSSNNAARQWSRLEFASVSYWIWFKLIATAVLTSCAMTAIALALGWLALQRDNQDGSGASIWMRRGRRACNAGRAEASRSYEPAGGAIPEGGGAARGARRA